MLYYKYSTQNLDINLYQIFQTQVYNHVKASKPTSKVYKNFSQYFKSVFTPKHLNWLWFLFALFITSNCLCVNNIVRLLKIFIAITGYLGLLSFSGLYVLETVLTQKENISRITYLISLALIIGGFILTIHSYPQTKEFALYMIFVYFIDIFYVKSISKVFSIILTSTIPLTQMLMVYVLTCVKQNYFLLFGAIYVMMILYKIIATKRNWKR